MVSLREELCEAVKVKESVNALEKVSALKESWREASRHLDKAKRTAAQRQPRSYANAANGGRYAAPSKQRTVKRAKPAQQWSRPSNAPTASSGGENGSGAATADGNAPRTATRRSNTTRELVREARWVWGTLPLITCTTVKNTISRLTSS